MKQDELDHLKAEIPKALERSGVAGCMQPRRIRDWAALFGVETKDIQRMIRARLFPPAISGFRVRVWTGQELYGWLTRENHCRRNVPDLVAVDGPGIDSYNRMAYALLQIEGLSKAQAMAVVGEAWSGCDNLNELKEILRTLMLEASRNELNEMMTPEDLEFWRSLADTFTVWRGCYRNNRDGLSWTLSRELAEGFPYKMRYRQPRLKPILLEATVRRDHVVYNGDREEDEIIAPQTESVTVHKLAAAST